MRIRNKREDFSRLGSGDAITKFPYIICTCTDGVSYDERLVELEGLYFVGSGRRKVNVFVYVV